MQAPSLCQSRVTFRVFVISASFCVFCIVLLSADLMFFLRYKYVGVTSIDKCSQTTINVCVSKRCFYIASLNNDMFQLPYQPSSGCTFSYFKVNYKIYNVFVNKISCTSIKSAFKITTLVAVVVYENIVYCIVYFKIRECTP